jgi:hypothetical protein
MLRFKVNTLLLSEQPPASIYTFADKRIHTHDRVIQLGDVVWTSALNANIFFDTSTRQFLFRQNRRRDKLSEPISLLKST